jgi:hypothetical protein
MAYDERLADRIRRALARHGAEEKKMFGGIAFMVKSHMCCGVIADELMVRVGPDRYDEALGRRHARPMDFTGKPLVGYVYVAAAGTKTDAALGRWVEQGAAFVASLPPRAPKKPRRQPRKA